jgi:hypothetical protein
LFSAGNAGLGEPVAANDYLAVFLSPILPLLVGFAELFSRGLIGEGGAAVCTLLEHHYDGPAVAVGFFDVLPNPLNCAVFSRFMLEKCDQ